MDSKFTFIILVVITVAFLSLSMMVSMDTDRIKGVCEPEQETVTDAQGWALACAAMMMEKNHIRHDTLATGTITPELTTNTRNILGNWWGVRTRIELLETLERIDIHGGNRKSFEEKGRTVSDMSEEQFEEALENCGNDRGKRQELETARKYYKQLGDKSIIGWDYTRYVALCRWGYTAEFLTEEEAWDRIMPVAKKLQKTFDSWDDFGNNYLIGRQFWSYKQTRESGGDFKKAYHRLTTSAHSPWKKYPWDMDLSGNNVTNQQARQ
jgi:hypothetical protein